MNLRHPLARAKGLGASGEGAHHWWLQRLSALALIPLSLWFVFEILNHMGDGHQAVTSWIAQPGVALLLLLYLVFMFFHAQLGLQVIIEDYISTEGVRLVCLLTMKAVNLLAGVAAVFSVLRIAFS